ncbi:MAG: metallophosphoesterase, partial [Bacteroidales bacterium]|nr:metallophosphoesterase [Bacteroidales bacterium]
MDEVSQEKKLISQNHFFIAALIGGPFIAGIIAGHNLWKLKLRWKSTGMIFSGLILNLLLEVTVALFAQFVLIPLDIDRTFWVKIFAVLCSQVLFVYLISLFLKIKRLKAGIFPEGATYYGKSQIIALSLFSFVYLLVHIDIPMLFAHFPNMILLFYVIPHIYFYNKTKHVFTSYKQIIMARWVLVIIACYMPLAFALNDLLLKTIMNVPMFLAEYYIYAFLYLFLLVLGVDVLGKLSLQFRFIPATFIRHPITKVTTLIAVIFGLIIILVEGNNRYNRIVENEFNIRVQAKDAEIDSLTICFVADMHLNNFTSKQFIDDYIEHISQIHPDIILYGGDMLESGRISEEKLKKIDKKLTALKPVYGKYIVGGNHDRFNYNGYNTDLDITFLTDTVIKIANSFYLMGLQYRTIEEKPVQELKKMAHENLPVFLLDHSPYQLDAAYTNNIDIQLSGHTHYGQVWPIN